MSEMCKWQKAVAGVLAGVILAGPAAAAPPGELPFGVYDPFGDFSEDDDVQIEHLFLPWEDVLLTSIIDADEYAVERDRALLVTIEPWTWSRAARTTPDYLLQGIRNGLYDDNMRAICEVLGALQSPVTVRWAQEMDDTTSQFIWAGWSPRDYILSFRRVIDVCREVAPNVSVMWSPLGYETMGDYYPGDEYVDVIGVSVFGLQSWEENILNRSRSFSEILRPRYDRALQFDKPVVVAELGYRGDETYVEDWTQEVRQVGDAFPRLSGVIYFNQREVYPWPDGYGLPDWRLGDNVVEGGT